jgi:hypothetical protein
MTAKSWLGLILGTVALGASIAALSVGYHRRSMQEQPTYVFHLENTPPFLTDGVALEKAREAMTQGGFDGTAWQPVEDKRSLAPDNTPDQFLGRNSSNPNRGVIVFVSETDRHAMAVTVCLDGNRVVCQLTRSK